MNFLKKIVKWLTGGGKSKSSSQRRTSSNNRISSTSGNSSRSWYNANESMRRAEQERERAEQERQRKVKEAFAVKVSKPVKSLADDSGKGDTRAKYVKAISSKNAEWKKTAEKNNLNTAKANRMAQLTSKYWQEAEKNTAKTMPASLAFAKGATRGVTMGVSELLEKKAVTNPKIKKDRKEIGSILNNAPNKKAVKVADTVGDIVGSMATFGVGTGGAKALIANGAKSAPKLAKTAESLANTSVMRKVGERMVAKGAFKGTAEEASKFYAKKLAEDLATDALVDHSLSLVDSANRAMSTDGSNKEKAKEFAKNQGLNVIASGATDIAPTLLRALKGSAKKGVKNAEEILKATDEVNNLKAVGADAKEVAKKEADTVDDVIKQVEKSESKSTKAKAPQPKSVRLKKSVPNTVSEFVEEAVTERPMPQPKARAVAEEVSDTVTSPTPSANARTAVRNKTQDIPDVKAQDIPTPKNIDEAVKLNEIPQSDVEVGKVEVRNPNHKKLKNVSEMARESNIGSHNESLNAIPHPSEFKPMNKAKAEVNGHFGAQSKISIGQKLKNKELHEEAQKIADARGERVPDTLLTEINNSRDEKFIQEGSDAIADMAGVPYEARNIPNEAKAKEPVKSAETIEKEFDGNIDEATQARLNDPNLSQEEWMNLNGVTDLTLDKGVTVNNANKGIFGKNEKISALNKDIYNKTYAKISYKEMKERAWNDVCETPRAVYEAIYNTINNGSRFTAVDASLANSLIRYGETYNYPEMSDLGRMFMLEYENEVGRMSGNYAYLTHQWELLSDDAKQEYLAKQINRTAKEFGFIDSTELIDKINTTHESLKDKLIEARPNKEAFTTTKDDDFIDVVVDNIIHGTDEEFVASQKQVLFDVLCRSGNPSILGTLNAWRYLSMLANPKTHIRNVVGNAVYYSARGLADTITEQIQKSYMNSDRVKQAFGENGIYRTRAFLTPSEMRELKKGEGKFGKLLAENFDSDVDEVMKNTNGRYDNQIKNNIRSTKGKVTQSIENLNDINGGFLEKEDRLFVEKNYRKSFTQFLKANGFGTDKLNIKANGGYFNSEEELISYAREFAKVDAAEATYRKANAFATALNKIIRQGQSSNTTALQKGVSIVANAIMPFTTTPSNLLVEGAKFSPLGLMQGQRRIIKALETGDPLMFVRATEEVAQGLTGTGIIALGMFMGGNLYDKGLKLTTSGNDEKYKALKRRGYQDYSLVYEGEDGKGWSVSLDWCAPLSQTLFTGAELARLLEGDGIDGTIFDKGSAIAEVATKIVDPVLNMSMLQGVNDLFDSSAYDADMSALARVAGDLAKNYFGSFVPSLGGAISRTISPYDYETVGVSESNGGQADEYWVNSVISKVPFLSKKYLAPKVDEKGNVVNEKTSPKDYAFAFFNNFISPANIRKVDVSEADRDAMSLYDALKEDGASEDNINKVFLKTDYSTNKSFGNKGKTEEDKALREKMKLNKWERAEYNKTKASNADDALFRLSRNKGWNAQLNDDNRESRFQALASTNPKSTEDVLNALIKTPEYKNASNADKLSMRNAIQKTAFDYSGNKKVYMDRGHSETEYDFKAILPARVQRAYENGNKTVSKEDYLKFYRKAEKLYYSDDGTVRSDVTKASMYKALNGMDLTEEQKAELFNSAKKSNMKPYGSGSGRGGRRRGGYRRRGRSGGSSKMPTKPKQLASASAFKVKVPTTQTIANASAQQRKKIATDFGLSESQLNALIKQVNRDRLKTK